MVNSLSSISRVGDIYRKTLNSSFDKSVGLDEKNSETFTNVIMKTIDTVDQTNKKADVVVSELATGKNVDIHQAMIAIEKADISFQFMMQVRNKLVSAYQEINRMQV